MRKEKLRTFAFAMALLMAFSSMDVTAYAADMQNGYAEETTLDTGNTEEDWADQEELPLMQDEITSDEPDAVEEDGEAISEDITNTEEQEDGNLSGEVLTEDATLNAEFSAIETEDTLVNSDYGLSNPRKDANGNTVWDCIEFGHYLQEDTNGDGIVDENDEKQPIKWRVLSVSGDKALLLSDKTLCSKAYNSNEYDNSWAKSTLRSWLNGLSNDEDSFIDVAFLQEEQETIIETSLVSSENETVTNDKIFLLSKADVMNEEYGFDTVSVNQDPNRRAMDTGYASQYVKGASASKYIGNRWWWLLEASIVGTGGYVNCNYYDNYKEGVGTITFGIRPAINIDLTNTSLWNLIEPTGCYMVSFDANGGLGNMDSISVPIEQSYALPNSEFVRNNYIFTGWNSKKDGSGENYRIAKRLTSISETYVLYAQWKKVEEKAFGIKEPRMDTDGNIVWDTIKFGKYYQSDKNGDEVFDSNDEKESILWRVLSISGNIALLLSDKNLDASQYHSVAEHDIVWENSMLRSWLNGYSEEYNAASTNCLSYNFIDAAFIEEEKNAIILSYLTNNSNIYDEDGIIYGGNDTEDKIFVLQMDDMNNPEYGFSIELSGPDNNRVVKNTDYVSSKCSFINDSGNSPYWLRSPGHDSPEESRSISVEYNGAVGHTGSGITYRYGVRPALYLDLSDTTLWSKAGIVKSNGEYYEEAEPSISVNGISILYQNQSVPASGLTISKNESLQLTADISPTDADNTAVTWTSADESIAVVSSNGLVTAVGSGTTMITVTTEDGGYTDSCKITVGNVGEPGKPGSPSENEPDSPSENEPGTPSENEPGNTKHEVTVIIGSQGAVAVDTKASVSISADDIGTVKDNSFSVKVTDAKDIVLGITPDEDYSVSEIKISDGTDALSLADILIAGNVGQKSFVSGNIILTASGNGIIGSSGCGYSLTLQAVRSNCTVEVSFSQTSYPIEISGESSEEAKSFENIKVMDGKVVDTISGKELESLPLPEKDGMIFEGWYTKDGQEVTIQNLAEIAKEKQEIAAKWSYLNVVVKQKVDITGLINLTDSESQKVKKYQVIYQNAKNTKYASVSTKGILTAKKADMNGRPLTVKVEALDKYKNILGSCYVTIVGTGMDKYKTDTLTHIGETFDMNTVITNLPSNGYDSIVWSVPKNCKYAVIDAKSGMLTSLDKSGKVKVTAEFINSYDGVKSVKISTVVTIKLPKQSVKKATVKTSKSKTLKLSNLTTQKVTWSVDNTSVIAISSETGTNNGKGTNRVVVTGIASGPAKVTAIVDGDESHLYVYEITIK